MSISIPIKNFRENRASTFKKEIHHVRRMPSQREFDRGPNKFRSIRAIVSAIYFAHLRPDPLYRKRNNIVFYRCKSHRFFFPPSSRGRQPVSRLKNDLTSTDHSFCFRDVSWISPAGRRNAQWRKERRWHAGSHEETKPRSFHARANNDRRRGTALEVANDSFRPLDSRLRSGRLARTIYSSFAISSRSPTPTAIPRDGRAAGRGRTLRRNTSFPPSGTQSAEWRHDVARWPRSRGADFLTWTRNAEESTGEFVRASERNARMKTMGDVVADPIDENDGTVQPASGSKEFGQRTLRSLKRGLGRLWRRHRGNVSITEYDPSYKVAYLGNVLTGWAKGEWNSKCNFCIIKSYRSTEIITNKK